MTSNIIPLAERIGSTVAPSSPEAPAPFDAKALNQLEFRARTSRPAVRDADGKLTGFADPRLPEDLTADDFAAFLTYTDRASYLAWVVEWKATYAARVEEIRAAKAARRALAQAGDPAASSTQYECHRLGVTARMLLALRRVAKAESWARRNAAATQED